MFGCEVYVARRGMELRETKNDMSGWHLILLAKNKHGYQNLIKLVSIGWVDGYYMRPRTRCCRMIKAPHSSNPPSRICYLELRSSVHLICNLLLFRLKTIDELLIEQLPGGEKFVLLM